jgi:hypothetical protein
MAHLGVPLLEIQKILGHESLTTTAEYIQSLVGADRKAMEIFAQKLQELFHTSKKQGASPEANPLSLLEPMWGFEPQTC